MNILPLSEIASVNGAFSPEKPGLQLVWDSTSYSAFQKCAFYYFLSVVQGIVPKQRSINLAFGIAYHSAMERYHRLKAEGLDHEKALLWTVAATYYRQLRTPGERTLYTHGYNEESVPEGSPQKSARSLCRVIVAYLDQYGKNDYFHTLILPSGKAAVELSFRIPIPGTPYSWAGHLDRLVTSEQPLDLSKPLPSRIPPIWNTDYKTTASSLDASYFQQFSPDIQMSGYTLGTQVILPVPAKGTYVDAIKILVTGQEFARQLIPRSPSQLEEFLKGFLSDMKEARRYAEEQDWPMRFTSCRGPYGDCPFRKSVCSKSPASRLGFLKADFQQRIWDPTQDR